MTTIIAWIVLIYFMLFVYTPAFMWISEIIIYGIATATRNTIGYYKKITPLFLPTPWKFFKLLWSKVK